ncbi:MAG: carbon-nitrogen hydrolase family protein [Neisseria sp.]|nr:carbon-nitrogen hydrolase family protein [Neisseria sp.]
MSTVTVAAIQMVSGTRPAENIASAQRLVREAAARGAQWVVLPEYWILMGKSDRDKLALAEPFGSGSLQSTLSELARECGITLFGGTIPLRSTVADKIYNSLLTFAPDGHCIGRYDKIHLFSYSGVGERYAEADTLTAGEHVSALEIEPWRVAQGICYDLRFPELFRAQGICDVLVLPAAFTHVTGQAHWELLLRARAVENQCYVIASGQGGTHENGRRTFGHSMVIDPWGEIVACVEEGEGMAMATLDKNRIGSVRRHLPAVFHQTAILPELSS